MSMEDVALLQRWAGQRDPVAFNELVRRYAGMVYATSRRILRDPTEAEDVAQECFLRLANDMPLVRSSLAGWLHAAATSHSLSRLRSEHRRKAREQRYAENLPPQIPVDEDLQSQVDEALSELPERLREPIVRHFLLGETQEAIARDLGLSRPAVTRRIERGVTKVRETLGRRGYAATPPLFLNLLSSLRSEGVPASLQATLGRIALTGPAASATPTQGSASALTAYTSWKLAGALALLLLVAVASWRALMSEPPARRIARATLQRPTVATKLPGATTPIRPAPNDKARRVPANGKSETPPGASEEQSASPPLLGVVVTDDGQPVKDAAISLSKSEPPEGADFAPLNIGDPVVAHTDAEGCFAVTDYSSDDVYLYASHPEFTRQGSRIDPNGKVRIVLKPGVVVEGRVTEQGEAADVFEVSAELAPSAIYSKFQAKVAPDGTYRIESVPPGLMRITASLAVCVYRDRARWMVRQVTAAEGEHVPVDFDFVNEDANLSGVVTFNGVPAAGVPVRVEVGPESVAREENACKTDESGLYEFSSLPSGPAKISVSDVQSGQTRRSARKNVEIVPGANRSDIAIEGRATIQAHVTAPADYSCAVIVLDGGNSLQEFTMTAIQDMAEHEVAFADIQGSGTVTLEGLPVGSFTVGVLATSLQNDVHISNRIQNSLYDAVPVVLEAGKQVEVTLAPH